MHNKKVHSTANNDRLLCFYVRLCSYDHSFHVQRQIKDKQLQQNAEWNRNASEKTKEASLINRKITNQLAGLSIDGKW